MTYFHAISNWFQAHPLWFTIIISTFFFFLGIYSNEIKRFIAIWPKNTIHSSRYNTAVNELNTIQYLHDNSYRLILYFAYNLVTTFVFSVIIYDLLGLVIAATTHKPSGVRLFNITLGFAIGKSITLYIRISQLNNYEESVKNLETIIAKYTPKKESVSTLAE